jgi:hypothetical protein
MSVTRTQRRAQLPTFREVKPERTTKEFRAYVDKALAVLKSTNTPLAQGTYRAIVTGKVKIDEVTDLTRADYIRARKDLLKWTTALKPDGYESLSNLKSPASKALDRLLNGYMWDDRIYVARGLNPRKLASTLVHEVNHFINKSEEHYRGPTQGLLEEYRAFYVEKLFAGVEMTPARCASLKEAVAKDYGFTKAHMDAIPDRPPGLLVPPH